MKEIDKTMFIASIVSAFAISSGYMFIVGRLQRKKAFRIQYENEIAMMQMISDELKSGKFANIPDFTEKMEAIIKPFRDQGLIK